MGAWRLPMSNGLKDLEAEHAELKKMYAELSIENRAMKNLIEKSYNACGEREAVGYLVEQNN